MRDIESVPSILAARRGGGGANLRPMSGMMTVRLRDSTACALTLSQDLERSETETRVTIERAVRAAQLCANSGACPSTDYCIIACAGLLARLDRNRTE